MGLTFEMDSGDLEGLCSLMCDNEIPKPKKKKPAEEWWIFTFGVGHPHEGHYVKIWGTFGSARQKMFEKYGDQWSFQYSEQEWIDWVARCPIGCPIEQELKDD